MKKTKKFLLHSGLRLGDILNLQGKRTPMQYFVWSFRFSNHFTIVGRDWRPLALITARHGLRGQGAYQHATLRWRKPNANRAKNTH